MIHRYDDVLSDALYPRVASSAGLSLFGTYPQCRWEMAFSMRLRRLAMKIPVVLIGCVDRVKNCRGVSPKCQAVDCDVVRFVHKLG